MAKDKAQEQTDDRKVCFVICPIGAEGSATRKRSDDVLTHVLEPVADACGYKAIRADKIAKPGIITNQVIEMLLDAPLVIADLTDHNANVYYELAVRHAIRLPLVEIIKKGQSAPFDVAATRLVQMDDPDLNNVNALKEQVTAAVRAAETTPTDADNPITLAIDIRAMRASGKPIERQLAAILEMLSGIQAQVAALDRSASRPSLSDLVSGGPGLGEVAASLAYGGSPTFEYATAMRALRAVADEIAKGKSKSPEGKEGT